MKKTNAQRLLETAGISFDLLTYPVDENDLSGTHIADEVGLPYACVFKTLVARGDRTGVIVLCIPVHREIDLKAAAAATGNKKVEMVAVKELLGLTGYIRGGCSPVGMKKAYPTYFDASALSQGRIAVSAGVRGCQVLAAVEDLLRFCHASTAALTKEETI